MPLGFTMGVRGAHIVKRILVGVEMSYRWTSASVRGTPTLTVSSAIPGRATRGAFDSLTLSSVLLRSGPPWIAHRRRRPLETGSARWPSLLVDLGFFFARSLARQIDPAAAQPAPKAVSMHYFGRPPRCDLNAQEGWVCAMLGSLGLGRSRARVCVHAQGSSPRHHRASRSGVLYVAQAHGAQCKSLRRCDVHAGHFYRAVQQLGWVRAKRVDGVACGKSNWTRIRCPAPSAAASGADKSMRHSEV